MGSGASPGTAPGSRLQAPDWAQEALPPFTKAFYTEAPAAAQRDAAAYRAARDITVWEDKPVPNPILAFAEAGFPPT